MRVALALGRRGLGRVSPNPAVGCVIVKDGRILGRGITQEGGRPHAETEALRQAGAEARGATVYVTLEPCSNYGRTPPCAAALVAAGVARVVIGCGDPDPRVNGKGINWLREAGLDVVVGCLQDEALEDHLGLYRRIRDRRPMISLKIAASQDGKIAAANGSSRWITGKEARAFGHLLRASHDAVMIGSGTLLADDPDLTCRLPGMTERASLRIVLDRRFRAGLGGALTTSASPEKPVLLITSETGLKTARVLDQRSGLQILALPDETSLADMLAWLSDHGLTRILVEGGATLSTALLRNDLVDRIYWFTAPLLMGGDARPAIGDLELTAPADAPRWRAIDHRSLGDDHLTVFAHRTDTKAQACSPAS